MLVTCPAKVNLFLSVGPKDEHGYHPLRTVFQAVGLFDDLTVVEASEDSFQCDWAEMPERNTVCRALSFLKETVPVPPLAISLTKRIPVESGLGGGSSDAAGLIRAVQKMLPDHLSDQYAQEVALAVGADVPFFLVGGRAKATGYGEKLEPLSDPEPQWLVIVKPDAGTSTASAFAALDDGERAWRQFPDDEMLYNDFERVAPCACREIAERLQIHGAGSALLAGSGSSVFGLFETEEDARRAETNIKGEGLGESWAVKYLTREESLWTS